MHTGVQVTTDDFEATPRREHVAIWFLPNDVPAERAAMRVLKGSHKRLGAHWQELQRRFCADPAAALPVRHGLRWEAAGEPDVRWLAGLEPTAMAAPRGSLSPCSTPAGIPKTPSREKATLRGRFRL